MSYIVGGALLECTAKIIIVGCSYLLIVTNQTVRSMLRIFMPFYSLVHRPYRSSKSPTSMKQIPRASKSKSFLIIGSIEYCCLITNSHPSAY